MKKILLLAVLFGSLKSFAQYPSKQHIGGDSTEIWGTMFWGKKGIVNGIYVDTTQANTTRIKEYPYAQIATDTTLWMRNMTATQWLRVGSGSGTSGRDTVFVKDDLTVSFDSTGHQVLGRLHDDGLVSGGVVTKASCWAVNVTSALYYVNRTYHLSVAFLNLPVDTADATFGRVDFVIADSLGNVFVRAGTPSSTPIGPTVNPSSELVLATINVPAGSTCIGITQESIWDENLGSPAEWVESSSGTITQDPNNTDNPENLSKAIFISTYTNGSKIIFTKSSLDTLKATHVLTGFLYLNSTLASTNQIQGQFLKAGVPVSNNLVLNPYFNPLDSNTYQLFSIPLNVWTWGGVDFDEFDFTFAGYDTSGAKGLYLDHIELQTGLQNNLPFLFLTTDSTSGPSTLVGNHLNIPVYSETLQDAFNNSAASWDGFSPFIDGVNSRYPLEINNISDFFVYTIDTLDALHNAQLLVEPNSALLGSNSSNGNSLVIISDTTSIIEASTASGLRNSHFRLTPNYVKIYQGNIGDEDDSIVTFIMHVDSVASIDVNSVAYFDANHELKRGHITVSGGGGNLANFYLKDSSLSSNRTISMNGNTFQFFDGANGLLSIDPVNNQSILESQDVTGSASVTLTSNSGSGYNFDLFSYNGTNTIEILGDAVANTIAYTAANNIFTGYGSGTHTGTPTYTAAFDATGKLIETAIGGGVSFIFNEQFTGSTSTTLTLSQNYISGTIRLFKNGVKLLTADFTEATANTITLNVARLTGDVFSIDFNY